MANKSGIDKKEIVALLKERIQKELDDSKLAFESSRGLATSSEMKSEGKYDTRSIEAGYIAGAQGKRVEELELELGLLDEIDTTHKSDRVSVGSLVGIELNGLERLYFISSTSGGSFIQLGGETVLIISAFSPIGSEVIGLSIGDDFEVETQKETRSYLVTRIV